MRFTGSGFRLKLRGICFLLSDGQGYWFCLKRLSQGPCTWWPHRADARVPLAARALIMVRWNGNPERAPMTRDWRRVA